MKRLVGAIGVWGIVAIFFACVAGPLLWVLVSSLKEASAIATDPWALPTSLHWENYGNAWNGSEINLGKAFFNSVIVAATTMAILIPISAMAAYALAKYPFPGSKVIFSSFLGGMMFPQFLVIVPLYLTMVHMKLQDTTYGLILVYIAFSLPFTVFVLHGFFQGLPDELAEAAWIDGCGHGRTFWQVMLPLAKPGLIVVIIFNMIGLWNEFNLALVLMTKKQGFTLPLALAKLSNTAQYTSDWGAMFAAIVIIMAPVLLVYWLLKDKIHEAMLAGAITG
jgi:N-acetylglucosamine transport system permease protein